MRATKKSFDSDTLRLMTPDPTGLFGSVILDEGHNIKSVATGTAQSVALLKAEHFIYLSATPMLNEPADLGGFLCLISRKRAEENDREVAWERYMKAYLSLLVA